MCGSRRRRAAGARRGAARGRSRRTPRPCRARGRSRRWRSRRRPTRPRAGAPRSATRAARRCRGPSRARSRAARSSIAGVMSTPITRPAGPGHLRGDQQVGAGAAAEVEHDRAGLDAAEQPVVGDAGEALDGRVGDARELGLGVAELLRPRAAGGEDELLVRGRSRRRCRSCGSPRAGRRRRPGCPSRSCRPPHAARRRALPGGSASRHSGQPSSSRRAARPAASQPPDGLVGVGAERAAAVGDDLAVGRAARPAARSSSSSGIERAPSMWPASNSSAGRTSTSTTSPRAQPLEQLVAADRLDVLAEVVARGALDLGRAARPRRRAAPATARSASSPASA